MIEGEFPGVPTVAAPISKPRPELLFQPQQPVEAPKAGRPDVIGDLFKSLRDPEVKQAMKRIHDNILRERVRRKTGVEPTAEAMKVEEVVWNAEVAERRAMIAAGRRATEQANQEADALLDALGARAPVVPALTEVK